MKRPDVQVVTQTILCKRGKNDVSTFLLGVGNMVICDSDSILKPIITRIIITSRTLNDYV